VDKNGTKDGRAKHVYSPFVTEQVFSIAEVR
jgi:hypothetical protein